MREESVCGPSRGGNTESSTSEHTAYCTQRYANRISLYQCEPVRYAIRSVMNDCVFFAECLIPLTITIVIVPYLRRIVVNEQYLLPHLLNNETFPHYDSDLVSNTVRENLVPY